MESSKLLDYRRFNLRRCGLMVDMLFRTMDQVGQRGSRSTVLQSLNWALAILISGLVAVVGIRSDPPWVPIVLSFAFGLTLLVYLSAYIWFMFKDPDNLRSQTYMLSKMAIQRGLIGDDIAGLIDLVKQKDTLALPAIDGEEEGSAKNQREGAS